MLERVRAVLLHRRVVFGIPFAWLLLFFLLPFALVLKISFSSAVMAIPPYEPVVRWVDDLSDVDAVRAGLDRQQAWLADHPA